MPEKGKKEPTKEETDKLETPKEENPPADAGCSLPEEGREEVENTVQAVCEAMGHLQQHLACSNIGQPLPEVVVPSPAVPEVVSASPAGDIEGSSSEEFMFDTRRTASEPPGSPRPMDMDPPQTMEVAEDSLPAGGRGTMDPPQPANNDAMASSTASANWTMEDVPTEASFQMVEEQEAFEVVEKPDAKEPDTKGA